MEDKLSMQPQTLSLEGSRHEYLMPSCIAALRKSIIFTLEDDMPHLASDVQA
jgi:hypothetical protein